jgi:predicted nucleic acid-binding protein
MILAEDALHVAMAEKNVADPLVTTDYRLLPVVNTNGGYQE